MQNNSKSLLTIFSIVFLDMLGFGIAIPVLAPLLLSGNFSMLSNSVLADKELILGLLIAIYPITQFFGAPILGGLSDKYGRKKLFLLSLFGTFLGYVLFAFGIMQKNILFLFIGRAIDGFTGGNISIAYSSISDISNQKDKVKNFGIIGLAFGLGLIIGPYIGGKLADPGFVSWFDFHIPFVFSAILTILNMLMVQFIFKETLKTKIHTKLSLFMGFKNIEKAISLPNLRNIFIVVFLVSFGFTMHSSFFQVYLIDKFNYNQVQIGELFAYLGIFIAITQGIIVKIVAKYLDPVKVSLISLFMLSFVMFMLLLPNDPFYIYLILPFIALFHGLELPNVSSIVSNMAGKESQGEIMGINQSIVSLAMAITPIIAGFASTFGSHWIILLSGFFIFLSAIAFAFFFHYNKKEKFHEI